MSSEWEVRTIKVGVMCRQNNNEPALDLNGPTGSTFVKMFCDVGLEAGEHMACTIMIG